MAVRVTATRVAKGAGFQPVEKFPGFETKRAQWTAIMRRGRPARGQRSAGLEKLSAPPGKMAAELARRIRPVIQHEIEFVQPRREISRQRRFPVERAPPRLVLRMDGVDQPFLATELGGARISDQFDPARGPGLFQQRESGKRDDEIAERAAPKDQNFSHPGMPAAAPAPGRAFPPGRWAVADRR